MVAPKISEKLLKSRQVLKSFHSYKEALKYQRKFVPSSTIYRTGKLSDTKPYSILKFKTKMARKLDDN